jgi:hypothetical protein
MKLEKSRALTVQKRCVNPSMVIGMRAIWMPILLLALAGCSTGPSTQPPALSPEIPPFRDLPKN